jgi:hypothetical protein
VKALLVVVVAWLGLALDARADAAAFEVQVRVIEAARAERFEVDPPILPLANDLKALPFQSFHLADQTQKSLRANERLQFQFPGQGKKDERFLVVTAHGEQKGGKLRFQLAIDALKFDTLVAVPNGGTILVAGPTKGEKTLIFAVTARKLAPK